MTQLTPMIQLMPSKRRKVKIVIYRVLDRGMISAKKIQMNSFVDSQGKNRVYERY